MTDQPQPSQEAMEAAREWLGCGMPITTYNLAALLDSRERALTRRLQDAEAKQRIDEQQCDEMTATAGRLAQENTGLREEIERLKAESEGRHRALLEVRAQRRSA